MPNIQRLIAIVVVCLAAAPAYAQTPPAAPRTFVDVSFGSDWDDSYSRSSRAPGATLATGAAFGLDFGTSGIEVDVSMPQWHEKSFPLQRYRYAGPTFGWQQQNHSYESSSALRRRSVDVMVFYRGSRPINPRFTFTWAAGGGYVFRPEESTGVTREVLPDGQLIEVNVQRDSTSRNYMAGATRLDVEYKVTPRLSIVPRVRITLFPALLDDSGAAPRIVVARPEVAVRWGF
jgi:hypothetical protein